MVGDRSRERRRIAAECEALAAQTTDAVISAALLELAQKCLALANLSEGEEERNVRVCVRLRLQ